MDRIGVITIIGIVALPNTQFLSFHKILSALYLTDQQTTICLHNLNSTKPKTSAICTVLSHQISYNICSRSKYLTSFSKYCTGHTTTGSFTGGRNQCILVVQDSKLYTAAHQPATTTHAKFSQTPSLKEFLLNTGETTIAEANPHDLIYGTGLGLRDPQVWEKPKWKGSNLLGKALEKVRSSLK